MRTYILLAVNHQFLFTSNYILSDKKPMTTQKQRNNMLTKSSTTTYK